jgi:acetyl esterase/lipase
MSKVWQPLDPDFVHRLNPEYVEYHKANLLYKPRQDQLPWDPSIRHLPLVEGGSEPLQVGSVKDYSLSKFKIRVFTPEGEAPADGWPVLIYFHGGRHSIRQITL